VIWLTVVTVTVAQLAATYLPIFQGILGTVQVPILEGILILFMGMIFFAIIELEKQLRLKFFKEKEPI
jgi:magnesium-transporting ATPase (P-type)